jgi:hypothetical protein
LTVIDWSALQYKAHSPPNKAARILKTVSEKRIRLFGVDVYESIHVQSLVYI